jgi:hypothetical protein
MVLIDISHSFLLSTNMNGNDRYSYVHDFKQDRMIFTVHEQE